MSAIGPDQGKIYSQRDVNMPVDQLSGKLQVRSREWMEFRVTFPQRHSE